MKDADTDETTASKFRRRARFSEERRRLARFRDELAACPRWARGADLLAGLDETLRDIDALEERLESKAVVAFVGGSGTGKSSLVNALCGRADAVRAGVSRPTTRKAAAVVRSVRDAEILLRHFDRGDLDVVSVPETSLPDAVLVDTPDTDGVECAAYSGILDRVLENADVLVCVFEAVNPKRKDNLDRLAGYVAKFEGRSIALVLNQADRVRPGSLERDVVPDFRNELGKSWPGAADAALFCTSVPPDGAPGFSPNGLGGLAEFVGKAAGRAFQDARAARAGFLRTCAEKEIREVLRGQGDWEALAEKVRSFEAAVSARMAERFSATAAGPGADGAESDMDALLAAVTPLWWGPVGVFLGFSRRFRRLVQTPFSLSDLLLPLGVLRRIRAFASDPADSGRTPEKAGGEPDFSAGGLAEDLRIGYAALSGEMVSAFGMDPALRDEKSAFALAGLSDAFRRSWREAHDEEVRRSARRCSAFPVQLLLNACSLVPAGYMLWTLGATFLRGAYLPGAFYRQAGALLALLWLLPSWLLQIRLNRAARSVSKRTAKRFVERNPSVRVLPAASEIERLARLAGNG